MDDLPSLDRLCQISTSTWSDALDTFGIKGVVEGVVPRCGIGRVAGPAMTVRETVAPAGALLPVEEFAVGRILEAIKPGSVLAISAGGAAISTFGSLAARAAANAKATGVLIDGGCRDVDEIGKFNLWLASRHVTPLTGKSRLRVEAIGEPIELGGVNVCQGDFVIADATGIVVIPAAAFTKVVGMAEHFHDLDRRIDREISVGRSFTAATAEAKYM